MSQKDEHVPSEKDPLLTCKGDADQFVYSKGKLISLSTCGLSDWLLGLSKILGYKLLTLLFVVQHLQKGFGKSFADRATPYMYKAYHVPAPQMQIYTGVTQLPWALKPIIGLLSDVFPIRGLHKGPYMLASSFLGAAAFVSAGLLPSSVLGISGFVACLFMISLQTSTCDLLSEAKYAEKMQEHPEHGPAVLTYVWFGMNFGGLVATLLSGLAIKQLGPETVLLVAALPASAVLIPVLLGYLEESPVSEAQLSNIRRRYAGQCEACYLCILILAASISLMVCSMISTDPLINCVVAACVAIITLVSFSVVLSPMIARVNAFALIQTALSFSTSGATFYFYTDTPEQYPEGPHFSTFFYNSVLGVAGALVSLLGIYCYQRYMSTWRYRSLLITTNLLLAFLSCFDVMMFARVNVRYGVPDHWLVLGLSIFEGLVFQWQWMPHVVILSYLCPKGMEATMYALLAGCHNLGNTIAANCGALLLDRLKIKPSGARNESAHFEHLWVAAAISVVLPLLSVLLLIKLMPDAKQNERLMSEENSDATAGSLWKRWWQKPDASTDPLQPIR